MSDPEDVDRGGQQDGRVDREATQEQQGSQGQIGHTAMEVDFREDEVQAWRGMGENSRVAEGLEYQLREALQKIDVLEDKVEELANKNEFKDKLIETEKFKSDGLKKVIIDQTITIIDNRRMIKNILDDNTKLKSDEKLAFQPELIELKRTKNDLEDIKKALEESKKAKEAVASLAETYKRHVDIVNKHLNRSSDINTKVSGMEGKSDCAYWMENRCRFSDKKCRSLHDPRKKGMNESAIAEPEKQHVIQEGLVDKRDCTFWLENRCIFSDKKCRGLHDPSKRGTNVRKQPETANQHAFLVQSQAQVSARTSAMEAQSSASQERPVSARGLEMPEIVPQTAQGMEDQVMKSGSKKRGFEKLNLREAQSSAVQEGPLSAQGQITLEQEPNPAKEVEDQGWKSGSKMRGFKRGGRRLEKVQTPAQGMEEQTNQ